MPRRHNKSCRHCGRRHRSRGGCPEKYRKRQQKILAQGRAQVLLSEGWMPAYPYVTILRRAGVRLRQYHTGANERLVLWAPAWAVTVARLGGSGLDVALRLKILKLYQSDSDEGAALRAAYAADAWFLILEIARGSEDSHDAEEATGG